MGVSSYMKGGYEEFRAFRRRKNKAKQSQSPAFGRKPEALNSKSEMTTFDKGDMKKQSQFVPGTNGATSYLKGTYDNMPPCEARKNKAKQSQL